MLIRSCIESQTCGLVPRLTILWVTLSILIHLGPLLAEDWPEWRGKGRAGIWKDTGILVKFPANGLEAVWRTPIGGGYAGPAVADGRVYVTDYRSTQGRKGVERALCLDERTGEVLWSHSWDVDYAGLDYPYGPRATPTVDGDRVYTLGAMGMLHCFNAKSDKVIWKKDYQSDFGADVPIWGMAGAPLVDRERLICLVGGQPRRESRRVRQDDGRGDLALDLVRQRAGILSSCHFRIRQHTPTHCLASTSRDVARSRNGREVLGAPVQSRVWGDRRHTCLRQESAPGFGIL